MYKVELMSLINESKPMKSKTIKYIKNLRRLIIENDMKDKVLRNIRNLYRLKKDKRINDSLYE